MAVSWVCPASRARRYAARADTCRLKTSGVWKVQPTIFIARLIANARLLTVESVFAVPARSLAWVRLIKPVSSRWRRAARSSSMRFGLSASTKPDHFSHRPPK